MADELNHLATELKIENNVIFSESLEDTASSLSCLDLFIMPSRQEGLGLSVMEAQCVGLPVIASNVGGLPSLIDHGTTGFLFKSEYIEELAELINYILAHPDKAKSVGQNARSFVLEHCSSEQMIDQTLSFYQRIIH